jgi:hypothetical protein
VARFGPQVCEAADVDAGVTSLSECGAGRHVLYIFHDAYNYRAAGDIRTGLSARRVGYRQEGEENDKLR